MFVNEFFLASDSVLKWMWVLQRGYSWSPLQLLWTLWWGQQFYSRVEHSSAKTAFLAIVCLPREVV